MGLKRTINDCVECKECGAIAHEDAGTLNKKTAVWVSHTTELCNKCSK